MTPQEQLQALQQEVERLRKLHDRTVEMARRILKERDEGYAVALQLADWGAYYQSGCADEETLATLRQMRRKLEQA
jgi:hypothetical protein